MELFARLRERFPHLRLERDFSFARHTTIGCGGVAAAAACPASGEESAALLGFLLRERIPFCYLGAGANVLPADGRFEGVVVRFSVMRALDSDGETVCAEAGVSGGALCRFALERGVSGFEPLTGIPMSVGGGVTMNAGVREGHFSDLVDRVVGIEKGKLRLFRREDCRFAEKESVFQGGIAVVRVYLKGTPCYSDEIARRSCYFRVRRRTLPSGRSMGCVFVNPKGESAGRLIEACGLKNRSVGGARVSREHANFILNEGGSARDVKRLIALVREEVERKTGIRLREEIRYIP